MLLIFALTAAYAVICPIITPFGLFYLIMKHGVDRYNLYYAYKRSKISKQILVVKFTCLLRMTHRVCQRRRRHLRQLWSLTCPTLALWFKSNGFQWCEKILLRRVRLLFATVLSQFCRPYKKQMYQQTITYFHVQGFFGEMKVRSQ